MGWLSGDRWSARSRRAASAVAALYAPARPAFARLTAPPYPVIYAVEPAGRQSRLCVAFRLLLAIPHLIALQICLYLIYLLTAVAWLIGVFSGRYDRGLASLPRGCLAWYARVLTYVSLLRDEYPPFGDRAYPIRFEAPLQERQGRATIFFRAILILPHVVIFYFVLSLVWVASVTLAWFALLISGRYPEGLRRLVVGLNRWLLRLFAYALLLRGDYPPFSLGLDEAPTGPPFGGDGIPRYLPEYGTEPLWSPQQPLVASDTPRADTLLAGGFQSPQQTTTIPTVWPETLPARPVAEPARTSETTPDPWPPFEHGPDGEPRALTPDERQPATAPDSSARFFRPRREPPPS